MHRALELDPLSYNALVNLGVHFQNQGDLDKAKELFRRALQVRAMYAARQTNNADRPIPPLPSPPLQADPDKHALEIQISFLLPPVMLSTEEVSRGMREGCGQQCEEDGCISTSLRGPVQAVRSRKQFEANLDRLLAWDNITIGSACGLWPGYRL